MKRRKGPRELSLLILGSSSFLFFYYEFMSAGLDKRIVFTCQNSILVC
ncbi:hypothetical protein [Psychrobacillus antarcticus]|nr:hypothetical protein [Psychrobacillus antarcticus]